MSELNKTAPLHISIADARERLLACSKTFASVFKYADCSVEFFCPAGEDTQQPHAQDELYIVSAGTGTFCCEERVVSFVAGDLLFVPANVPHRFASFSADFETWVVFFGPKGGSLPAADFVTQR